MIAVENTGDDYRTVEELARIRFVDPNVAIKDDYRRHGLTALMVAAERGCAAAYP